MAPVWGMEKAKFLMLRSRERGGTFSGLALPFKSGVFLAKRVALGGYLIKVLVW